MQNLQVGIKITLLALLCVLTIVTIQSVMSFQQTLKHADSLIIEAQKTASLVSDYAAKQKAILESPKNQKALEAGWQTPAVLNGTLREVNTLIIPRIMKTLDSSQEVISSAAQPINELAVAVGSLNKLVTGLDENINSHLLPEATDSIIAVHDSAMSISNGLTGIMDKATIPINDAHELLTGPVRDSLASLRDTSAQIAEASRQAPLIARDVERIAKTSSKWQKWILISTIIGTLAKAFL